jgi:predicted PurR-regulated permease PerM
LFDTVSLVVQGIFTAVALFLLAFYWTMDGQRTIRSLLMLAPPSRRDMWRDLVADIQAKVGGYIRGISILSLVVGSMALVAYLIIGVPYAIILAIIAGLMEAVPVVGPALGAIPAALVAYSFNGMDQVIWVLLASSIIQLVENTFLVPRIMGRSTGVNPIVSLLALVTFSALMGVAGALLAIPIAAVIQLLLDRFVLEPGALDAPVPPGRDAISALRMEVNELSVDIRKHVREKEDEINDEADRLEDEIESLADQLDHLLEQSQQEDASA